MIISSETIGITILCYMYNLQKIVGDVLPHYNILYDGNYTIFQNSKNENILTIKIFDNYKNHIYYRDNNDTYSLTISYLFDTSDNILVTNNNSEFEIPYKHITEDREIVESFEFECMLDESNIPIYNNIKQLFPYINEYAVMIEGTHYERCELLFDELTEKILQYISENNNE